MPIHPCIWPHSIPLSSGIEAALTCSLTAGRCGTHQGQYAHAALGKAERVFKARVHGGKPLCVAMRCTYVLCVSSGRTFHSHSYYINLLCPIVLVVLLLQSEKMALIWPSGLQAD